MNIPLGTNSIIGGLIIVLQILSLVSKKIEKITILNLDQREKMWIIFFSIMIIIFDIVSYYSKIYDNLVNMLPAFMLVVTLTLLAAFTFGRVMEKKYEPESLK